MSLELPPSPSELEALLTSAVLFRASHIKKEIQTMTLADVRRLLETDLGLEKYLLDPHKAIVRKLVDEVLLSAQCGDAQHDGGRDGNNLDENIVTDKARRQKKLRKKTKQEMASGDERTSSEELRPELKKKQKMEKKGNIPEAEDEERKSRPEVSESSDVSEGRNAAKVAKALSKHAGAKSKSEKKIHHLKTILKACGLNVPPAVYKKAKQESESKRDSFIMKEMESILGRHGLSTNPSDKEIKAVKRKIAREKDLEGIDTTNIITEPRGRRSMLQPFPPVYRPPSVVKEQGDEGSDDGESSLEVSEHEDDAYLSEGAFEGVQNNVNESDSDL